MTGKVPFEGQTAVSIAVKHYRDNLPSARKINPKVPQALENVILHATAKKLKDRYPDAETMARDLKTALLPVRKNEPKWEVPTEDDAETKTLVIPTTESSKRQPSTGSRKTKKTKQQKKKTSLSPASNRFFDWNAWCDRCDYDFTDVVEGPGSRFTWNERA